jgi:PAS domain-containing protein
MSSQSYLEPLSGKWGSLSSKRASQILSIGVVSLVLSLLLALWLSFYLRRVEQELREANEGLENAAEGVARLDRQGRYVFVNGAYAGLFQGDPARMAGTTWSSTIHPKIGTKQNSL